MRNSIKTLGGIVLSCCALWACHTPSSNTGEVNKITLPQDAIDSCTIAPATFNSWFVSGTAAPNGAVNPANSVTFPHQNNCDFYQWSENMFLWVTSPASGAYGSSNSVLESPVFYNVSAPDSAGKRTLTAHSPNTVLRMSNHITKTGPNRLPVILDKSGKLFEVEDAKSTPASKAMVKNASGATVEVSRVSIDAKGALLFTDKNGNPILHPQAIIHHKLNAKNIVQKFVVGNKAVFLDSSGNQVQSEAGQATGDVLMAQNGSLVYYLTLVNDVYAYYLTGTQNDSISTNKQFPTTAAQRDMICAYARAHHTVLPDSNALAMEIKSSWVEASTLTNPGDYFTVMATIPTYNKTNPALWIPNGEQTVKMAMVGIHIVGSVAGHPEMVWATFEHQSNSPNAAYQYLDVNHKVQTVPQDTGTHWLFSSNAADTGYNASHMKNVTAKFVSRGDTIAADSGFTISPSNTLATMPWGSAKDSVTNQQDQSSAASNSEIISINNIVRKLLGGPDVRANYLLVGATWTQGGVAPNGLVYGTNQTQPGVSIGTSVLANTTMETYFQSTQNSCFTCHSNSDAPSLEPAELSHIYGKLIPLFMMHDTMSKAPKNKANKK